LRREEIRFQVAPITPLIHIQGYTAPETKAAAERAHLLIERAEALGEPPEDPLLLFSALYGIWVVNLVAFNRDVCRALAVQFLALAEKQGATVPLMMGHRLMGMALVPSGDIVEGRAHFDRAIELYDPASHRQLATHFGQDIRVAILSFRSWALWLLGFPDAALADVQHALEDAREIRHAASLMYALTNTSTTLSLHRSHTRATAQLDQVAAMAAEQGSVQWKVTGMGMRGSVLAQTGKAADAVQIITEAIGAWRRMGSTLFLPWWTSHLAWAFAELGKVDDAWRCIDDAMATIETTKERWFEAEARHIAGEIALMSPPPDAAKAEKYFEGALAVARAQQAKSWELRAAMSMARLWRDQGKSQQARELLAPVYGWFTEGFDTRDLKEAKALLEQLAT
jgi:predicted ATPase